jgi:DNA-binding MarR family transcriptional regulator
MTDHERLKVSRREMVAILDELAAAGLIQLSISSRDFDGPEPQIEITTSREVLAAPTPAGLSARALRAWVLLTRRRR